MEVIPISLTKATKDEELRPLYDLVILGGGPAGLSAAIYAARSRMRTLLVEKETIGGEAACTSMIENYPGFPNGIHGVELTDRMRLQAERFGAQVLFATPETSDLHAEPKEVVLNGRKVNGHAIIVASGTSPKHLGIPGESELKGRGVSYCATCDGPMFTDKDVAVIGCGNSGLQEGLFILNFARSLTLVEFLPTIQAEPILQERILAHDNIRILLNHKPLSIQGEKWVESLRVMDRDHLDVKDITLAGIFIYIGLEPNSHFLGGQVELDPWGFIPTDDRMQTSVPGVFAAGDIRATWMRQVATATADGAMAAHAAYRYLESQENRWA